MDYKIVNNQAKKDKYTSDKMYNDGLNAIRKFGIENCKNTKEVRYWLMCNGFIGRY